jgi:hypothetical protein
MESIFRASDEGQAGWRRQSIDATSGPAGRTAGRIARSSDLRRTLVTPPDRSPAMLTRAGAVRSKPGAQRKQVRLSRDRGLPLVWPDREQATDCRPRARGSTLPAGAAPSCPYQAGPPAWCARFARDVGSARLRLDQSAARVEPPHTHAATRSSPLRCRAGRGH